jgi:poly-beta-1,6-N-acetyl-D-glucosamine synthase
MIWLAAISILTYCCVIVFLYFGYSKVHYFEIGGEPPATKFSIIIPFRNEAENLARLLRSLQQLNYPSEYFEIIFVNDASTDTSEEIIRKQLQHSKLTYTILQNTPLQASPKKAAITLAISAAQYPWILTTDADCTVPENWLQILNEYLLKTAPICVAMPVAYKVSNTFLQCYQQLDNWSLQAVTVGSFGLGNLLLSNGANFAYAKEAFEEVNGFEENLHIASGDDIFLLEKFKQRFPKKIGYLKSREAVVTTQPVTSWKQLVSQRVRWASKTSQQKSLVSKLVGLSVFAMNLLVIAFILYSLFSPQYYAFTITVFVFKFFIDFLLVWKSVQFFNKPFPFVSFLISTLIYPLVTVWVVLATFSGNYVWKERSFKKQ